MLLQITINECPVNVELYGVTEADFKHIGEILSQHLANRSIKNRDAIFLTYMEALKLCPQANKSDLWHHIIYRQYLVQFPKYRSSNPDQSWVRASGEALELVVQGIYKPVFMPHGIHIKALLGSKEKQKVLEDLGIADKVGKSKLDVIVSVHTQGTLHHFAGIHVKASLAERVSDDVPTSRALMNAGYFSVLWTLDVKSFPPPGGDLVNRGELGTPEHPTDKRRYIEEHGDFDACYSANSRTVPSKRPTKSGKMIFTIDPSNQPDQFAKDIIAMAKAKKTL